MENTAMNYQDFLDSVLTKAASIQNDSETHFTALRLIELVNSSSHLTTTENVKKFFEVNVKILADDIFSQTLQTLKINSSYLNEKPRTGDFSSRYEAYKITFKVFNDLPISDTTKSYVQLLENKINNLYQKNKSGCYIATMVYGDYDHTQVRILRSYRDNTLSKSSLGRWFVVKYYKYSPVLVMHFSKNKSANLVIRIALNQFIKIIK
jgi:hypothetical protein